MGSMKLTIHGEPEGSTSSCETLRADGRAEAAVVLEGQTVLV